MHFQAPGAGMSGHILSIPPGGRLHFFFLRRPLSTFSVGGNPAREGSPPGTPLCPTVMPHFPPPGEDDGGAPACRGRFNPPGKVGEKAGRRRVSGDGERWAAVIAADVAAGLPHGENGVETDASDW